MVHEYVTGGGLAGSPLPQGLAAEGGAMLRAVLADFAAWGGMRIVTTVDERMPDLVPGVHESVIVEPGHHKEVLWSLASRSDAALVIAPEEDGVLADLSALVLSAGAALVGSSPGAVRLATDKWTCHQLFIKHALPAPETLRVTHQGAHTAARYLGFPVVVKPIDGLDCKGVGLARDPDELDEALALLEDRREFLIQPFIQAAHASVSLLVSGNSAKALSLNVQRIVPGRPFSYQGGFAPLEHPQGQKAMRLAEQAARLIPGLKGYVGADVLLTPESCLLMEINPRLTTSYVGLSRIAGVNMARAMVHACLDDALPESLNLSGKTAFDKEGLLDHSF